MGIIDEGLLSEVRGLFDMTFDSECDIADPARTRDHGVDVKKWVFPTGRGLVPCSVQEIVRQPAFGNKGGEATSIGDHTIVFPYGTPLNEDQRYKVNGMVYAAATVADRDDGFTARVHVNRMG